MSYDVFLERLHLVTLQDDVVETMGDTLATVGAGVIPGDPIPRPFQITLPIHGSIADDQPDPYAKSKTLRRQIRSMLANPLFRLTGLYFQWAVDDELNCWLMIGQSTVTDPGGAGITVGEWRVDFADCYKVADSRTHRPAFRQVFYDRTLVTTGKDELRSVYDSSYAGQPVLAELWVPAEASDAESGGASSITAQSITRATAGGSQVTGWLGGFHGQIVTFEMADSDLAGKDSDVVALAYTGIDLPDTPQLDPVGQFGWEEMYGPDYPIQVAGVGPILQNGLCRIIFGIGPGIFTVMSGDISSQYTPWAIGGLYTADLSSPAMNFVSCSLIEYTPERAVIMGITTGASRLQTYITLQRGWPGPLIELYNPGDPSTTPTLVLEDVSGYLNGAISDDGGSVTTGSTTTFTSVRNPWMTVDPTDTSLAQTSFAFYLDPTTVKALGTGPLTGQPAFSFVGNNWLSQARMWWAPNGSSGEGATAAAVTLGKSRQYRELVTR